VKVGIVTQKAAIAKSQSALKSIANASKQESPVTKTVNA
jgi:hypothetical protein